MSIQSNVKIVIPGDHPVQIAGSPHLARLDSYGEVVLYSDRPETLEEKVCRAKGADILMNTRGAVTWGVEEFHKLPSLKMITSCSIGTDMFDLEAANARGIVICNQPGRTAPVVAEHLFGLMFATAKRAAFLTAEMKVGRWPRMDNVMLQGKVLGIVGNDVEDVEMIQAVPGHLDQIEARDPCRPAVFDHFFSRETGIPQVLLGKAVGQRVLLGIGCPDMYVGVNDLGNRLRRC